MCETQVANAYAVDAMEFDGKMVVPKLIVGDQAGMRPVCWRKSAAI